MYTVRLDDHLPSNPRGFRWMPAAVDYANHMGLGVFVRYKRNTDKPITIHLKEPNRIILQCPDRDLMLVRDQHHVWPYKPAEGVWDEYVHFPPGWVNAQSDIDLPFWMMNYTESIGVSHSPKLRLNRERAAHEAHIVADSGGFQLMMGRLDWLDPKAVVHWYNENVDLGMILDIPTGGVTNPQDFLKMARAQARNTEIMMQNKRESLELINIFHGTTEQVPLYQEIVERPDIDRLAIGGVYQGSYMSSLDSLFNTFTSSHDKYKHFHILGVFNLLQLIPIMRFAGHDIVDLITSDSSTPVQNANAKRYAYNPAIDSEWQLREIGSSTGNTHANHHIHLPCACPVCKTLKYTDVLSILGGAMVTHMLCYHNVYQMNNYIKTMAELAPTLSVKELTDLMMCQVGNRRAVKEATWGIQLADSVAEHGYDAARKKFSIYLNVRETEYVTEDSLFDTPADKAAKSEDTTEAYSPDVQRKLALADKYLQDTSGVHGKKLKTAPKYKAGVASATTRKTVAAGKKGA